MAGEKDALAGVKVFTCDIFGTMVDWFSGVSGHAERVVPGIDGAGFARAWRELYAPALVEVNEGKRAWGDFEEVHRDTLASLQERFGFGEDKLDVLLEAWRLLDPWEDVVEGIERLRKRYMVIAVSNGAIGMVAQLARRGGYVWDAVLGAQTAGAYKPDPRVYKSSARFMGVEPEACAMVACHPYDLEAARGCGFRTVYVHRVREWGGQREKPEIDHGDVRVESLHELADMLDC